MKENRRPVAAIIQARMGSKRLPGKSMTRVYGSYTLLEMVLLRVKAANLVDLVVLATSKSPDCDPLAKLATTMGGICILRGDENDVLSRFIDAITIYNPKSVVRICADNPLIAPEEIDRLVAFFLARDLDYAANNLPECGLADGLGCEIVSSNVLRGIAELNLLPSDREHVTSYLLSNTDRYATGYLRAPDHLYMPEAKLDIDTRSDLKRMRNFCHGLSSSHAPLWTSSEITCHARSFFSSSK